MPPSLKTKRIIFLLIICIPILVFILFRYISIERTHIIPVIDEPCIIAEGFKNGKSVIYGISLRDRNIIKIITGSAPDVSPTDDRIAFVADDCNRCLHILDLEKREEYCITAPVSVRNPRWSPEGTHIVVTSLIDGRYQVFEINMDETIQAVESLITRQVTQEKYGAMYPSYSNDGKWIYYNLPYRHRNLMRIHRAGLITPEIIAETKSDWFNYAASNPVDGSILFSGVRSRRLYRVAEAGGRREVVVSVPVGADPLIYPRWLPGGETIIFCGQLDWEPTPQVYLMNIADGETVRMTDPRTGIRWRSASVYYPGK